MTLFDCVKGHNVVMHNSKLPYWKTFRKAFFTIILLNNMFYKLYEIMTSGYDF